METKIVPLNPLPDHPKYLRLPSLSRSLVHSILPKDCQAMYTKPSIFSISVKPHSPEGPPKLSNRSRRPAKAVLSMVQKPLMVRPNSPSYIYKKMFLTKEEPVRVKPKYYKSHRTSKKDFINKTSYFCEINSSDPRGSATPHPGHPRLPGTTFAMTLNSAKQCGPNIKRYYRSGEASKRTLMKNISEARSSQESSTESLNYFHMKQVSV